MKEYEEICGKYEEICEKYEEICRKYEGICRYGSVSIYLYVLWDSGKFRILPLYMGLGTWKNSTPKLLPGLWDFEKIQALPL